MKLESCWLFKKILLMFSYILAVSRGYILVSSICPMLKAGKLQSIASSAILAILFENYFKRQKYAMGAFCSTVQKFHLLFCVGSLNSHHWE